MHHNFLPKTTKLSPGAYYAPLINDYANKEIHIHSYRDDGITEAKTRCIRNAKSFHTPEHTKSSRPKEEREIPGKVHEIGLSPSCILKGMSQDNNKNGMKYCSFELRKMHVCEVCCLVKMREGKGKESFRFQDR